MAGEALTIDPTSEDAANTPLSLIDNANGWVLLEHAYPPPALNPMYAGSVDTEGDPLAHLKFGNRTITLKLRQRNSSASAVQTQVGYLQQKIAKINREGGTLRRTVPSGSTVVFDLITAEFDAVMDQKFVSSARVDVTVTFTAKPFGRGAEETLSDHTETTAPVLVFTEASIPGDVAALGRLVIDEDQGADQAWAVWGIESRNYSSASTAKLFYECKDLTPIGAGSYGNGTGVGGNVYGASANKTIVSTLTTSYEGFISSQASGGGAHWTHTGSFRVFARVGVPLSPTVDPSVRLQWANGDFRSYTSNEPVRLAKETAGSWRLVDLGLVHPSSAAGFWEMRLQGRCEAAGGASLDVNWIKLVPVKEGSGQVYASDQPSSSSGASAWDDFDQSAGALTGKTLPSGGTWSGAGDADDFTVNGTGSATRTAVSDTSTSIANGRLVYAPASLTACAVRVSFLPNGREPTLRMGAIARYTDTSNFAAAFLYGSGTASYVYLSVVVRVAGTSTTVAGFGPFYRTSVTELGFDVAANGSFSASIDGSILCSGYHASLATGGALASGKAGVVDHYWSSTPLTRYYEDFSVSGSSSDACVFASQSLEIASNMARREDSAGVQFQPVGSYRGNYLLIPPSGREGRTIRMLVKLSRGYPEIGADVSAADDVSARLYVTPRYLVIPD